MAQHHKSGILSPKKYILTRARTLPLYKCFINPDWTGAGLASIVVLRRHTNGNITSGVFLVDLQLGWVKDAGYTFNEPESFFDNVREAEDKRTLEETEYHVVHNIVYQAVDFGGPKMKHHKDFQIAKYILEEDSDAIPEIYIPLGDEAFIDAEDDNEYLLERFDHFDQEDWQELLRECRQMQVQERIELLLLLADHWVHKYQPFDTEQVWQQFEHLSITTDPLPLPDNAIHRRAVEDIGIRLQKPLSEEEVGRMEEKVIALIKECPDYPPLHNYLGEFALIRGDKEKHRLLTEETMKRFPDYLFGKLAWLAMLMQSDEVEKVSGLLGPDPDITKLVKGRASFHLNEVLLFYSIAAAYLARKEVLGKASAYYEVVLFLLEDNPIPDIILNLQQQMLSAKAATGLMHLMEFCPEAEELFHPKGT